MKMNKWIKILITGFCLIASSLGMADEATFSSDLYKVQVGLLKAEITLAQCNSIKENLNLESKVCDLVSSQYNSFAFRAKRLVDSVPRIYKTRGDEYYVSKISDLINAFPDTTDKEILDAMMGKVLEKDSSKEQLI